MSQFDHKTPSSALFIKGMTKGDEKTAYNRACSDKVDLDQEWNRFKREVAEPGWRKKRRNTHIATLLLQFIGLLLASTTSVYALCYLLAPLIVGIYLSIKGMFQNENIYYRSERDYYELNYCASFIAFNLLLLIISCGICLLIILR